MAITNFDTTQAPPGSLFTTITNVSSNGTHWVFASGLASKLVTALKWVVDSVNTFTLETTINMPSTAASYNGIYIQSATKTCAIDLHWESQNHYDVRHDGTYVYTGSVTGGVDVKLKIICSNTDTKYYINDVLVYTGTAIFANSVVRFGINKYTEGAGYVRSGLFDGVIPVASKTLSLLGIGG